MEPQEAVRLLAHTVVAERIYLLRMKGLDPWPQEFWPPWQLDRTAAELEESAREWRAWLASPDLDWERRVAYRNTKGINYSSSVRGLATHVFFHGMHHRGQISQWLARSGVEPPPVDYIVFEREFGLTTSPAATEAVRGSTGGTR
jgi:uncharacterized damage-inducible protein DinB